MKVIFHDNQLNERGTSVALYDYALHNETLLGNESVILYPKNEPGNNAEVIAKFKEKFQVLGYRDVAERDKIIAQSKADAFYALLAGQKQNIPEDIIKTCVHAVFKFYEPFGDVYAYISEWLSQEMSQGEVPFVPHMINLPDVEGDLRNELNIPKEAKVFARYGGGKSFDIKFAQEVVKEVSKKDKNTFFIFMGTDEFVKPSIFRFYKNIIFLPPSADLKRKVQFINTSDAFLHARQRGETFGIAIGEFSVKNKPIITFGKSDENAHLQMLGDKAIVYNDKKELKDILLDFKADSSKNWDAYSENFNPREVMKKFNDIFLQK